MSAEGVFTRGGQLPVWQASSLATALPSNLERLGIPGVAPLDFNVRATGPATPELPAAPRPLPPPPPSLAKVAAPAPPATQTTLAAIRALARETLAKLNANDPVGALDVIHGQRLASGDADFDRRFLAALSAEAKAGGVVGANGTLSGYLDGKLVRAQRTLFDAYLRNPGGVAEPHDLVFLGVDGVGSEVKVVAGVYDRLARDFTDPTMYAAAVRDVDLAYADRYGGRRNGRALDDDMAFELSSDDLAVYRSKRIVANDALQLHRAVERHDSATMFALLERNSVRVAELAAELSFVTTGTTDGGLALLHRAFKEGAPLQARLAVPLLHVAESAESRTNHLELYARGVIDAHLAGELSADRVISMLETLGSEAIDAFGSAEDDRLSPKLPRWQSVTEKTLRADLGLEPLPRFSSFVELLGKERVDRLRSSSDPLLRTMVDELVERRGCRTQAVFVAKVRRAIDAGPEHYRALASLLDMTSLDDLKAARAAIPDFEKRISQRSSRQHAALGLRLSNAMSGKLDAVAVLQAVPRAAASVRDVLVALAERPRQDWHKLPADYDAAKGKGAFAKVVADLPRRDAQLLQLATTVVRPNDIEGLLRDVRRIVKEQRADNSLSSRLMDRFGFTGPVLDDALRGVTASVRALGAIDADLKQSQAGRPDKELARGGSADRIADRAAKLDEKKAAYARAVADVIRARDSLREALAGYGDEQDQLADDAAMVASLVVGGLTCGVLPGLNAAVASYRTLSAMAAVAGGSSVGAHAALAGDGYRIDRAVRDFALGAGIELGGSSVMRAGPALGRLLKSAR